MGWLRVVGGGPGNPRLLTTWALEVLQEAQAVVGREDLLCGIPGIRKVFPLEGNIPKMLALLEALHGEYGEVVLVLSGDPTLFSLLKYLPREWIREIVPGVSVFQYFASRLGISWDGLSLLNLHATSEISRLLFLLETGQGAMVYSGDARKTQEILRVVSDIQPSLEVAVGVDLSLPGEQVLRGRGEEVAKHLGSGTLHLVYLPPSLPSGLPFCEDAAFVRDGVPLSKRENRMLVISVLELSQGMQVLEVGSGAGGMTVEIARRCPGGMVYAIEQDENAFRCLLDNLRRFHITNVCPVHGKAPEAIPQRAYHRIFVGGSGGRIGEILERAFCVLLPEGVVAFVALTLETLEEGLKALEALGVSPEVVEQSVTRFVLRGGRRMAHSLNSIFLVWGRKHA